MFFFSLNGYKITIHKGFGRCFTQQMWLKMISKADNRSIFVSLIALLIKSVN